MWLCFSGSDGPGVIDESSCHAAVTAAFDASIVVPFRVDLNS